MNSHPQPLYAPDTNVWSRFLRQDRLVTAKLLSVESSSLRLLSPVRFELLYGRFKAPNQQKERNLRDLFTVVTSMSFDDESAEIATRLRVDLRHATIGPVDLLIAAICLAHDLILVTHNSGEFQRVPGLRLEDWEI